ncbi:MAG: hypothetical protein JXB42_08590, partial [Deltaproteobacteria bacterium]|nr:hypothetical protein [Deltaproteobacteria bacterium]
IWQKKFREDLLYRLNVVAISIPPLRQRLEDLPLLISHFQKEISKRTGKTVTVSNEALDVLRGHLFPGNVRELLNILEFSSNISESDIITPSHLPMPLGKRNKSADDDLDNTVKNAERERIVSCLRKYGMSVNAKKRVAAELDISLSSLYNKIRQYNIKKDVNVSA